MIYQRLLLIYSEEHNLINGIGITKLVHGDINKVNLSNLMHPHSNIISFGVIAYCLDPFAWLARIDLFSVDKIFIYVVTSETLASKSLIILRCLYHSMPSLFSRLLLSLLVPLYQISFGIDNRATARELLEVNIVPKTLHIKSQKWWLKNSLNAYMKKIVILM